ncbi:MULTISPECIES: SPOR domain-containing protein [unclassified Paludibacterium]|uniref:SPOR domain-containing protein n=1 Tax=unclassified Paludibacterium TaxID=2618429 RepID=UPI00207B8CD4|nr:SPOR domain-containing protein [Paludibacterium sp. B53371]
MKNSSRPARSHATSKRSGGGGGVMMGVIIGLIVGVAAVVGVVMYFSKAGTPFTNLQKMEHTASQGAASTPTQILSPGITLSNASANDKGPVEAPPAPSAAASQPATAPQPAAGGQVAKPQPADKDKNSQRFDFYKILPGQVDAVVKDGAAPAAAHADNVGKKPYLQLGAFQDQDDADNLKAKLALIGVEATIQSADVPGKGIVHRVRVGPFATQADIDRVRSLLKQNGIDLAGRPAN